MPSPYPIIRVELRGGLGNQLFQAAAAHAVARRIGATIEFELFHYRSGNHRDFGLNAFHHGGRVIHTPRNLGRRLLQKLFRPISKFGFVYAPGWRGPIFKELSYAYDRRIESIADSCYLRGYFQSWRYFDDIAVDIRTAFDPALAASIEAVAFAEKMERNALAVHIRAGDYAANPKARLVHGTLPASYYQRAIGLMQEQGRADKIFCFSDTIEAARSLLEGVPNVTFVEGFNAFDDLYLMSRARSHIIANSTFSYWSAWLATPEDGLVIAPKAWFTEEELKKVDISDLFPPEWITV